MDSFDDVRIFMEACDQMETGYGQQCELYRKLIKEEFEELMEGLDNKDIVEIADACADLKWVIEGLEHTLNVPQQDVWDEVARSNLQKIGQDGKVMKPEGWTPPDIETIFKV